MVEPRLTKRECKDFLRTVKDKLRGKGDLYDAFLKLMKSYKARRISRTDVQSRVKVLFKEHQELLSDFNRFWQKYHKIAFESDRMKIEFSEAIDYVKNVKARFQNDDGVYKSFLNAMEKYKNGNTKIVEVYEEVAILFQDHQDLLKGFGNIVFNADRVPEKGTSSRV